MTSRRSLVRSIVAAPLALSSARLWAQAWPSRPVRIVVPFAPGGSTDAIGRMLAAKLTEQLGTNVLVENKAGANSIIGTTEVAKSAPDGHTLLLVTPSLVINPLLVAKLPFDPARDLVPVTQVSRTPYVVGVSNDVPAGSIRELIAFAKANPGKLAYASGGTGTGAHLTTEAFKIATGTDMVHVPYKGTALALPDLVAGRIALIFDVEQVLGPMIRDRKIRGLAITSDTRSPTSPELPTMKEAGVADFVTHSWIGLLAPRDTPADIVTRLSNEVRRALASADGRDRMATFGAEIVASTPEAFGATLKAESERWSGVARHIGLKPE